MTTEEKAKAYDEALERTRAYHNKAKESGNNSAVARYEAIFPELRESEDERIRKWIIKEIKATHDYDSPTSRKCVDDALSYLEKQKEQKPAESISQLTVQGKGVYKICPHCKSCMVRDDSKVYTSMPPQYGYECPICGAMEFDTIMYDNPEIEERKPVITHGELYHTDTIGTQQVIAGKMPQKPTEWSEEDEIKIISIIAFLKSPSLCAMDGNKGIIDANIKYLKSIKDKVQSKSHWKPSEEQMRSLEYFIKLWGDSDDQLEYVKVFNDVKTLYNDLKKL